MTVVTPEHTPLSLFGEQASAAVAEELEWAGDRTGAWPAVGGCARARRRASSTSSACSPCRGSSGPIVEGARDGRGRLHPSPATTGSSRAASARGPPATASSRRSSSAAWPRTRRASPPPAIARLAGVEDVPDPGEPVLHGRLLVGHRTRRLRGRGDAEGAPLWWPHGKVAGEYLPRWLAEHGVAPPAAAEPPDEGITIRQPVHAMRAPESQYLYELGRQYRSGDPAIAALGHRMREARER